MEIRAILSLAVSKFQTNAKIVAAQFRAMTTNAADYSKNVDKFIERNLNNRLQAIEKAKRAEQRALSFSSQSQQTAAPRQGSTALAFGQGEALGIAALRAKQAGAYTSQITEAERKATADRVAIASRGAKAASKAEQDRYNQWLKVNTKQDAEARKFAESQRKSLDIASYFNSEDFDRKLASTRYALYDISRRAAMFGVAIGTAFAAAIKSAIDFESAFTSVERTTQLNLNSGIPEVTKQAQELRATLVQLTSEIPLAFADIANIATIGAQMGIAADAVDEFTETVARFSAITGIAVEDVSLAFGRIAQLTNVPVEKFENLSSAIAFTGINSVATDKEILRMAESISASATAAGFAAEETIGLASALASLKIRPEEARGVLLRLFREFDLAVSESGSKLDDLARVVGKTSEQAALLFKQDASQFFQAFLTGANAGGELNKVLTSLGITNTREARVITSLANNMGVLEQALADSSEQFELGTFAAEAYASRTDDVAAKLVMLQNAVAALGDSFGADFLGPLGEVIDALRGFVSNLAQAPLPVRLLILGVTGLIAALLLGSAAIAGGVAGLLALKLAFQNLQGDTIKAGLGINTLRALLISMIPAAAGATTVTGALGAQLKATAAGFGAASAGAKAFQASLGIIGLLSVAAGAAAVYAGTVGDAAKKAEDLAKANFEAAGGLEAFKRASDEGVAAGATIYGEITAEVAKLTQEQIEQRRQTLAAAEARAALLKDTEDGAAAYADAQKKLKDFNDEVDRGNGLLETSTIKFTENTKEVIANALSKIDTGADAPLNIFAEIAEFDSGSLSPSARASLEASGIDIAQALATAIEVGMSGEMTAVQSLEQQFANADFQIGMRNSKDLTDFVSKILTAGGAFDGLRTEAEKANAVTAVTGQLLGNAGADAESAEGDIIDLNDSLRATISSLTSIAQAEGNVANTLDTFAKGAAETGGEMDGLGEAARTNLSNFASFMDAAVESSIAAGTGTKGALETIIGGLNALEAAGINTGGAFQAASGFILNSLESIIPGITEMFGILGAPQSMRGVEDAIRALYSAKIAAADTPDDVRRLREELQATLSMIAGFGSSFQVNMGTASKATEKVQTKLEKLQAAIAKLFSWTNKRMALQDSINSLGDSLEENGNTFSIWSEAGRSNVGSLLDVIDNMAVMANGDMQLFANQLGAMRAALVKVGAPASALKLIDDALKATGKRAKVSTKEVENFYRELQDNSAAKKSLAEIATAVSNVQSSLRAGISAYFAQQNAIDDITLGWLDMADASEAAQEAIDNAAESIEDARRTIDEARASMQSLSAQSNILEYQLQIALKYGDTLRADEIRGEMAEINAQMAEEQDNIADANQAIANSQRDMAQAQGELGINSTTRQIIDQNRALQEMAIKYADAAAWMLATAGEGADLNAIIESQVTDFYNNALQMGYTETQAKALADVMRSELLASMEQIPDDITTEISAETSAALAKVTKFASDANARLATIKDKVVTVTTRQVTVTVPAVSGGSGGSLIRAATGGLITGAGTGTSDSITAKVSNGEYVIKAAAVNRYGVDFFNAINQMQVPQRGFQVGSVAAGGAQTVYLSPEDRQLLRQAIDRPVALYTDNATIAQSANAGNQILAQRGIR